MKINNVLILLEITNRSVYSYTVNTSAGLLFLAFYTRTRIHLHAVRCSRELFIATLCVQRFDHRKSVLQLRGVQSRTAVLLYERYCFRYLVCVNRGGWYCYATGLAEARQTEQTSIAVKSIDSNRTDQSCEIERHSLPTDGARFCRRFFFRIFNRGNLVGAWWRFVIRTVFLNPRFPC